MLSTSLGYILVRTFPECATVLIVGCYFLKLKIPFQTLIKKALILGIIQSFIRMLPISFGIHTIIGMGIVLFMLVDISKDTFINCIMALCKIFLCLILSESIYVKLFIDVLSVPESLVVNNYTVMGAIYSLPSLALLVIFAFSIEVVTKQIQGGNRVQQNK